MELHEDRDPGFCRPAHLFLPVFSQIRFNVESQAPTVAKRGSIIHIMKTASYSSEVIGNENGLWIEVNILGYTTLYPTTGVKPDALPGAPVVKVAFPRSPVPYTGYNKLHFNTLDAIANCTVNQTLCAWQPTDTSRSLVSQNKLAGSCGPAKILGKAG